MGKSPRTPGGRSSSERCSSASPRGTSWPSRGSSAGSARDRARSSSIAERSKKKGGKEKRREKSVEFSDIPTPFPPSLPLSSLYCGAGAGGGVVTVAGGVVSVVTGAGGGFAA